MAEQYQKSIHCSLLSNPPDSLYQAQSHSDRGACFHYQIPKELWFLFDALDSGLSIDAIAELKTDLFQFVIDQNPDKDVYIIVSANGYEFANGERCYDVANCKEVTFKDYNDYRKFILKSRQQKIKRNKKWFGE